MSDHKRQPFREWFANNVPVLSLLLMKLCPCGGSVVEARWRWERCRQEGRSVR